MMKAARTVYIFGIYLFILAIGFLIFPNKANMFLGLEATTDVWIRVTGMLLLGLAYYYIQAARMNNTSFIRNTVHTRPFVIVFFAVFVYFDLARTPLILIGGIDFAAALWTAIALRRESVPILKF